jgi:hypothetical protein
MATANAYGSITIVDMTDIGQFSVVPMSNAGILMIYDPNALSNQQYTPASITLSPFTMYGGTDLSSSNDVTYTWYKKTGSATFNPSNPGEASSTSRTVTVNSSDFSGIKNITYYVKAVYEYTTNQTVTAWGQISISLVTQATNIQDIEISGDRLFRYKYLSYGANPTIDGSTTVTLTATYTSNVAVHQWYYYKRTITSGTTTWSWETLPIDGNNKVVINGSTCTVYHDAPIFYDNKAKIKVTAHRTDATSTELTGVYDEYEILKLYDGPVGAPGEQSVAMIVTNEDQTIPCDSTGPTPHAFDLASTEIYVLEGNDNVTTNNVATGYKVTASANGVTSTNGLVYDSTNHKYTYAVTGWDANNSSEVGSVTFTATRTNYPTLIKTMSLNKILIGSDGESPTVYQLSITPNRVATNASGATTAQTTLTASVIAVKENVQTDVTTSSTDVIYYEWYKDGTLISASSGTGPNNKNVYTIANGTTVSSVVCKIKKTNSSGTQLDSQSVPFVAAGQKGSTGATGDGAITLDFPQSTDTIGLRNDGTLATAYSMDFPYTVYQGTRVLNATASNNTSLGYSFTINNILAAGDTSGATITWDSTHSKFTLTIPAGTKVYDSAASPAHSLNGQCTVPITYTNATSTNSSGVVSTVSGTVLATFSWNLDIAPADGTSITISDTWTKYKQTNSSTQPSIAKTDSDTIAAAITAGGLSKPYYVWGRTHIDYSPTGSADTYTVNFYPVDPVDGKSVQTSSTVTYAWSTSGDTAPSSGWQSTIASAVSGKTKPYYVWTRNVTSYTYQGGGSAGSNTTTYSTSYYPADKVEVALQANSTIFNGSVNTITIQPIVTKNNASYTIANGDTVEWWYILNGTMTKVTSTTTSDNIYKSGNNLVVKSAAVNGGTSVQFKLTTSGQTIYRYLSLEDYTDEFRCDLYSSIGDKITNGQGSGYVSCLLYRNGQEIHKMTSFSVTTARTSSTAAVLSITTESLPADISSIVYAWTYQQVNASGGLEPLTDASYNSSGKAIYIDGSMINKKIVINCEVTITYVTA